MKHLRIIAMIGLAVSLGLSQLGIHNLRATIAIYQEQIQMVKNQRDEARKDLERAAVQRDEALTAFAKLNGAFIQMSAANDQNLATANRCISSIESVNAAWRKRP